MIRPCIYFLALCFSLNVTAQQPETFKAETNRVVVDVIVTDKKGHHVPGLTASDFSLMEEGAPQRIESFTENLSTAGSTSTVPVPAFPSTGTSTYVPPGARPHLVTVVMDLADNRPENLRKASDAVLKYLEKNVKPNDYIAIYSIDRGLRLALPFTNDVTRARATLASIGAGTTTSALGTNDRKYVQRQINDLYAAIHPESAGGIGGGQVLVTGGRGNTPTNTSDVIIEREIGTLRSYLTIQNTLQAKSVFVALKAICTSYNDIPGRKNVVLFSEGFLYADEARPQMEAVADAANRANVALYVIDSAGLESKTDVFGHGQDNEISQLVNLANETAPSVGSQSGGLSKFDKIQNLGEGSRNNQLEYLADVTGGMFVKNMNDLAPAFAKVIEDAQNFYSLSYRPTDSNFDGKFRKIKVELARKGYDVRYRKGYWAVPRGQAVAMTPAAAQMIATVRTSGFKSAFPLDIYANVLMAPDGHFGAPVSVSFPGSKVPLTKNANVSSSNVTLLVLAYDESGRILGLKQSEWPVQVENKNVGEFAGKTLTLQSEMQVAQLVPITLQTIVSLPGGVTAMSARPISVTPQSENKPQLSSLMMTSQVKQESCADKSETLCLETMRLVQPAKADFAANGQLVVYFTVVNLAADPQSKQPRIAMDLKLKGADNKAIAPQSMQAIPGPTVGSVLVLAQFDLKQLGRGKYSAQATAQDLVRKNSASNEAEFSIE
jgi:VWFA-related protein